MSSTYPFNAIVHKDDMKTALILNIINPKIGGVLLSGEKGTGKSTAVRALSEIIKDVDFINLPLNITEDRLVGSIDIKAAVNKKEKKLEYGLLKEAHNNILYIDEVNLLSRHIINIILEINSSKINVIEREGLSYSHPSDFILIGSMNPEEGILSSQFIDRFGLFVNISSEDDLEDRKEIMKRRLLYEKDTNAFLEKYKKEDEELITKIKNAKKIINNIRITEENINLIIGISKSFHTRGHRAEIVMVEAAKAIAAYHNREYIIEDDIKHAAKLALPHRMNEQMDIEEIEQKIEPNQVEPKQVEGHTDIKATDNLDDYKEKEHGVEEVNDRIDIKISNKVKKEDDSFGKRSKVRSDVKKGRYIKYRNPVSKSFDIAVDATIRNAALKTISRNKFEIRNEDIREKVRERRTGAVILFVVDASGSMGARKRMSLVKGVTLSILNDAYEKRDSVGIIAFRNKSAELILDITRSVELAEKKLKKLKTGGKTPLALGLQKAYDVCKIEKRRKKNSLIYLVLVTDGKENVGANEDVIEIAHKIRKEGIEGLVLDAENAMIEFGFAKKIAEHLDAEYIKLNQFSKSRIEKEIKELVRK